MFSNNYLHVSFDLVDKFYPRIPKIRCEGEDSSIPRICVSDNIKGALNAIPDASKVIEKSIHFNYKPIIHVYHLIPRLRGVVNDVSEYVPDAGETGEKWLIKTPLFVYRKDYMVEGAEIETKYDFSDGMNKSIKSISLKEIEKDDNWNKFLHHVVKIDYIPKNIENLSFSDFMSFVSDETIKNLSNNAA